MLKKIKDSEKKTNPGTGPKLKEINKDKMGNVVKNAKDIYELRNKIVRLKEQEKKKLKKVKKLERVKLENYLLE